MNYRWTTLDALNATLTPPVPAPETKPEKWSDFQRRKVTPYGFVREMLLGCDKWKAGDSVPLDLRQSYRYPFEVMRFGHSDFILPKFPVDIAWLPPPPDASDCPTIGALCKKLLDLAKGGYSAKYGMLYDAFADEDPKTLLDRRELARAIFEFWDNTDYRYAVLSSGQWTPTSVFERPWDLPTKADVAETVGGAQKTVTHRIQSIPAHRPKTRTNPVAPGAQALKSPDPLISQLDTDIAEIEATITQIMALLKRSREIFDDRMRLVAGFVGLEALVSVSSGAARVGQDNDALPFVPKLKPLPERVRQIMAQKAESDFVAASGHPEKLIRHQLGSGDDIADEVERLAEALLQKLIGAKFGNKSGAWAKAILEQKLKDHPGVQLRLGRLGELAVSALEVVADAKSGDTSDAADKLWKILADFGDSPAAVTPGDIRGESALGHVMALLGTRANQGVALTIVGNVAGNLPGYPSITVALAQTATLLHLPQLAVQLKGGTSTLANSVGSRLLSTYRKALGDDAALIDSFETALKGTDRSAIADVSKRISTKLGANWQGSYQMKFGVLGLQILAFLWTASELKSATPKTTGDKVIYYANALGSTVQAPMLVVGALDSVLTLLDKTSKPNAEIFAGWLGFKSAGAATSYLAKGAFVLGKVSAVISIVTGTLTVYNEVASNGFNWSKVNGYTVASGVLGGLSGLATLGASWVGAGGEVAFLTGAVSCPPLALAAAVFGAASVAVVLAGESHKLDRQEFNRIVASDLESIAKSPYYQPLLTIDKDLAKVIEDLKAQLDSGTFPKPNGDPFTRNFLRQGGFSPQDVDSIVGGAAWGATGGFGGAQPALPQVTP